MQSYSPESSHLETKILAPPKSDSQHAVVRKAKGADHPRLESEIGALHTALKHFFYLRSTRAWARAATALPWARSSTRGIGAWLS